MLQLLEPTTKLRVDGRPGDGGGFAQLVDRSARGLLIGSDAGAVEKGQPVITAASRRGTPPARAPAPPRRTARALLAIGERLACKGDVAATRAITAAEPFTSTIGVSYA